MNLNSYCEHVLPTSLEHLIGFDLDSSIKMCEHDAIHYLTQQGFTQNEEILVAHLEVKHDVGVIDKNRFYHLIKSRKIDNLNFQLSSYDFLTKSLIKETALEIFKISLDKYHHPLLNQAVLDFYTELSEPTYSF